MNRSLLLIPACAAVALGCSSEAAEPDNASDAPDATTTGAECTAESLCSGCTTCFDKCRCGGGDMPVCADSCRGTVSSEGDAGPPSESLPPMIATLVMDSFEMGPGEEIFKCQNFANPFGQNAVVLSTESFMTTGSHHMFVFQQADEGNGELEDCSGLEFHSSLHLAQQSQSRTSYPPGIGRLLTAGEGLRLQVHYLNASSDTITPEVAVTIQADTMEAVPTLASGIFINTVNIGVAPRSEGEASTHCTVPKDIKVLSAASHMHSHGVYFTARGDKDQLLYETTEWEEPEPWQFDPPLQLSAGSSIDIHCEYQNDTDRMLNFGESAATNEMCIFAGVYYPAEFAEGITCLY